MIVLQSLWTGVAELSAINQKSAIGMSSPGGEGRGEGELNHRGRQSALTEVGQPCPSGIFENSQQHARAIYGWVHSLYALGASVAESMFIRLSAEALAKADVHPWLNCPFWLPAPANPQPKSTAGSPKSTVDLRSQPLIWVDKRSASAPFAIRRHSFAPITMRKLWNAGQKQTDTGQKVNPLTVDLGCATALGRFPGRGNPLWTGPLFCSTIAYMASPSKAAGNNPANQLPFEEALKKLEGIVEAMEADDLPLETLLAKYEEGSRLVTLCRGKLSEAELKVQQLEKNADKEMKLKPFEAEETI